MDINLYLQQVATSGSPDLHFKVGRVPIVRLANGELYEMQNAELMSAQTIKDIAKTMLTEDKFNAFLRMEEVDSSYSSIGVGRFRLNAFWELDGPALAFRSIPEKIPSLYELGMPPVIKEIVQKQKGLVVVTGPTGSGKSTTLAAMINEINSTKRSHIITIEDPIEFVHQSKMSLITQREVGTNTQSFPSAIKSSLRQDPDVILIGEMRDLETISAALTLAETGHLVFATLHTQDAPQAIDRILDVFPSGQQGQIRSQLSSSLIGVVAQRLIPKADGNGRVMALEILIKNDAIANCIKDGNTNQIYSMMQIGKADGVMTLDSSLSYLLDQGFISEKEMRIRARDPELILKWALEYKRLF